MTSNLQRQPNKAAIEVIIHQTKSKFELGNSLMKVIYDNKVHTGKFV